MLNAPTKSASLHYSLYVAGAPQMADRQRLRDVLGNRHKLWNRSKWNAYNRDPLATMTLRPKLASRSQSATIDLSKSLVDANHSVLHHIPKFLRLETTCVKDCSECETMRSSEYLINPGLKDHNPLLGDFCATQATD